MKLDRVIAVRNNKTIYRDGEFCVKVFGKKYSKADVLSEAVNYARIEESRILVPKLYEVTMVEGKFAIVTGYIKGKTLLQMMEENSEKMEEYMEFFVTLHLGINSEKVPLLNNLTDKLRRKINSASIEENTKGKLLKQLDKMQEDDKVCHGDFNPSNVIVNEEGKAYIVDWAHPSSGNVLADVARTYLWFLYERDIKSAEKYLEIYQRENNISYEEIKKWIPIVAAAQSVSGNKDEREFMISRVDYK